MATDQTLPPLTTSTTTTSNENQSPSTQDPYNENLNPVLTAPQLDTHIDTSPLSPTLERKNSLEKKLQTRPEAEELKERHILLDTDVAPGLQARQKELERQRVADGLRKNLASRPTAPELIERNILPDSKAAPALQSQERELKKHLRADSLEKALQGRPEKGVLVREGILREDEEEGLEGEQEESGKEEVVGGNRGIEEVVSGRFELE